MLGVLCRLTLKTQTPACIRLLFLFLSSTGRRRVIHTLGKTSPLSFWNFTQYDAVCRLSWLQKEVTDHALPLISSLARSRFPTAAARNKEWGSVAVLSATVQALLCMRCTEDYDYFY